MKIELFFIKWRNHLSYILKDTFVLLQGDTHYLWYSRCLLELQYLVWILLSIRINIFPLARNGSHCVKFPCENLSFNMSQWIEGFCVLTHNHGEKRSKDIVSYNAYGPTLILIVFGIENEHQWQACFVFDP